MDNPLSRPQAAADILVARFQSHLARNRGASVLAIVILPFALAAALPFVWIYISSFKTDLEILSPTLVWWLSSSYIDGYIYIIENTDIFRGIYKYHDRVFCCSYPLGNNKPAGWVPVRKEAILG